MGKQSTPPERTSDRSEVSTVAAEAIIRDVEDQRAALLKRRAEHDASRERIAFAARAHHDRDAIDRLSEMTTEAIRFDHELRDIESAMTTARARLQEAQAAEARKAERERAAQLRAVIERLKLAGQTLDDALSVVVGAGSDLHRAVDEIHSLGFSHPTGAQLLTFGERATVAALMELPWKRAFPVLPPGQRTTFARVIREWEAMLQNAIAAKLRELQKGEAA